MSAEHDHDSAGGGQPVPHDSGDVASAIEVPLSWEGPEWSASPGVRAALDAVAGGVGRGYVAAAELPGSLADSSGVWPRLEVTNRFSETLAGLWSRPGSLIDSRNLGDQLAGITGVLKTLDAVQPPWSVVDTFAGFSRDLAAQVSAMTGATSALASVRAPMFETQNRLSDTLAGLWSRPGSLIDTLNLGDRFAGITGVLKTLDAVGAPFLDVTKLASTVWAGVDHSAFVDRMMGGQSEALVDALRGWSVRADRGLLAARVALRMALRAVSAVKRGDLAAVKKFMAEWLGFTKFPIDLVTSASLVLLDVSCWLPDGLLAWDFDPCPKLRGLILIEHRRLKRQLIDPDNPALQLNGRPLLALDKPVKVLDGVDIPLGELRRDKAAPDPAVAYEEKDITDPRVLRLWWKFTDRERAILYEKGQPGTTWPAAAVAIGGTAGEGERLRRKVRRLSKGGAAPAAFDEAVG